jgi:hypothetical protein
MFRVAQHDKELDCFVASLLAMTGGVFSVIANRETVAPQPKQSSVSPCSGLLRRSAPRKDAERSPPLWQA